MATDWDQHDVVQPFGVEEGRQWTLASLRDEHGSWKQYFPPESEKDALRHEYVENHPGAERRRFDSAWPSLWLLTDYVYPPDYALVAIVDSGIVADHPQLSGCIKTCVDFTGEGIDDRLGHGTNVALIYRQYLIGAPPPHLVILKIFDAAGAATRARLLQALTWIVDYNARRSPGERIASTILSCGVYSRRWGALPCDGHCDVCETARRAAPRGGMRIVAAAGNRPGRTACPARAAFGGDSNIVAGGSSDEKLGIGTIALPTKFATIAYVADGSALDRANRAAFAGDAEAALHLYTQVAADPRASTSDAQLAAFNRCYSLGELGRLDEATACYHNFWMQHGTSERIEDRRAVARAMNETAKLLPKLGRTDDAIALDDALVARFGTDPDVELRHRSAFALRNKGSLLAARGAIDDAIVAFEAVVRRYGEQQARELRLSVAAAQLEEANALRDHGRSERSLPVYQALLRRLHGSTVRDEVEIAVCALIHFGISLAELGRTEEAAAAFDTVTSTYSNVPDRPFPEFVASAKAQRERLAATR